MNTCSVCGRREDQPESFDHARAQCRDRGSCLGRSAKLVSKRLLTKPFVGFDPDAAYATAPKLGRDT